jgi:feruloyl esterase
MTSRSLLLFAVAGLVSSAATAAMSAASCRDTAKLRLSGAQVQSTEWIAAGQPLELWRGAPPTPTPIAFCRVRGVATPVAGSRIGFEVWLPDAVHWNGRFLQAGNGGLAGAVPVPGLFDGLRRGYAAAGTDGGHETPDGLDASWALGHPERLVDFGWRAVTETERVAKAIVKESMGRPASRSYFVGCSNGGRDALIAAQRLPLEFDGIVAGAPAADWTGLMVGGALIQRELAPPRSLLPSSKLPALQQASLAACAEGKPYVQDPLACRFDPAALQCDGADSERCLTPPQVEVVRRVYRGMKDPVTHRRLYGLEAGAEAEPGNWDFWLLASPTNPIGPAGGSQSITESFFRYAVRGDRSFTWADLKPEDLVAVRRLGKDLDAVDPDLRPFRDAGGKLLQYHGWTDAAIPPRSSVAYHEAVAKILGDTSGFHRLFMVPGMNHCAGGAGPWDVDWLDALERWVERGEAPGQLTARDPANGRTQTLIPYVSR